MTQRNQHIEITVPLCEAFAAIGIAISAEQLKTFERALFERGLNVAPRANGEIAQERKDG